MIKYCNTIKYKLKNNGETNKTDVYVKICHTLNDKSSDTDRHVRRLIGLVPYMGL